MQTISEVFSRISIIDSKLHSQARGTIWRVPVAQAVLLASDDEHFAKLCEAARTVLMNRLAPYLAPTTDRRRADKLARRAWSESRAYSRAVRKMLDQHVEDDGYVDAATVAHLHVAYMIERERSEAIYPLPTETTTTAPETAETEPTA